MDKLKKVKSILGKKDSSKNAAHYVLYVVLGTEFFHLINSFKLNLIMPTIGNVLKESTVRSWQYGNGTICIRYGNFLWDSLSVIVFASIVYLLWRLVAKKLMK